MKMYGRKEAEGRIPHVVKTIALLAIELRIDLDNHPITSRTLEKTMYALSGQIGHLYKLFTVVWRDEGLKRVLEWEKKQKATPPAV